MTTMTTTETAAAEYAGALAAFLADPSFANSERLYATESAFGRARAEEAIAKSNVLLAMLAA